MLEEAAMPVSGPRCTVWYALHFTRIEGLKHSSGWQATLNYFGIIWIICVYFDQFMLCAQQYHHYIEKFRN